MIAPCTRQHLREQIAAGAHVVSVAPGDLAEMLDATEPGVVRIAAADWRLVSLLGDGDHGISARLRPDETGRHLYAATGDRWCQAGSGESAQAAINDALAAFARRGDG